MSLLELMVLAFLLLSVFNWYASYVWCGLLWLFVLYLSCCDVALSRDAIVGMFLFCDNVVVFML